MNNENITIINDTAIQTLIEIKIDNKNINNKSLTSYLIELEELNSKYSIICAKDGVIYAR